MNKLDATIAEMYKDGMTTLTCSHIDSFVATPIMMMRMYNKTSDSNE